MRSSRRAVVTTGWYSPSERGPRFSMRSRSAVRMQPEALTTLVSDLERGHVRRVAFVVPSGSWTLPLYELAIMTARAAGR